ncbi:MAG: hypothetical protein MUO52_15285, partial [Desulfobacterales bacterium]|nr:hypothetical protein [Desulfobacterales bacterium]
ASIFGIGSILETVVVYGNPKIHGDHQKRRRQSREEKDLRNGCRDVLESLNYVLANRHYSRSQSEAV